MKTFFSDYLIFLVRNFARDYGTIALIASVSLIIRPAQKNTRLKKTFVLPCRQSAYMNVTKGISELLRRF